MYVCEKLQEPRKPVSLKNPKKKRVQVGINYQQSTVGIRGVSKIHERGALYPYLPSRPLFLPSLPLEVGFP